jgi:hypothetical protein
LHPYQVTNYACCNEKLNFTRLSHFHPVFASRALQYVDDLGELSGAPGEAAELAQDLLGLELGVRALAG